MQGGQYAKRAWCSDLWPGPKHKELLKRREGSEELTPSRLCGACGPTVVADCEGPYGNTAHERANVLKIRLANLA